MTLLVAVAVATSGCSIGYQLTRPSDNPHDADCNARLGFAATDTVLAGASLVSVMYTQTLDSSHNLRSVGTGLLLGSAVLFGISAASGFASRSQCRQSVDSAKQDAHLAQVDEANRQADLAELRFARRGPFGGWGFAFGMPDWQARSVCVASRYWVTPEPDGFSCSGVPGRVPVPGVTVRVRVVGGRVGSAELVSRSDSNDAGAWMRVFGDYHHELERLWRKPDDVDVVQPDACRKRAAFLDCLRSGRAYRRETWRWSGGRRVVLELGGSPGEGVAIRALYDSGLGAR